MNSMKPSLQHITIKNNREKIKNFILEMIITPRRLAHKWAKITNQTPNLKSGYPFQHLASLIVGMSGTATGARGDDIVDQSEVKACSKVDQSDKCKRCHKNVLRSDNYCHSCGSKDIKRNNDSKWLISIRTKDELRMLLEETPRFIFLVTDYPHFSKGNYSDIRIRAFEVWVKSDRAKNFRKLMKNYYNFLYLGHKSQDSNANPAPKNLFPDSFQFYMCNPIKTFECYIANSLSMQARPEIIHYIEPGADRQNIPSEDMPRQLLNTEETQLLKKYFNKIDAVTEEMREYLSLRNTDHTTKKIGRKTHKQSPEQGYLF